ncbi:MAG TPA: peptidylprolyl isomerase [Dokdonella sp.]|uniref:peptidylprolyl isomerase n=2 Tax=Dokdonella sp. TaxID=2291710 RepID=UPI002CDD3172|nr:peptidylprolyl isomerase [Dokdonella sp.]
MRMNKLLATLILLLALAAPFAQAQLMPTEKLDGIVAVLDGDVILRSELERQVATVQAQYANNPQQLPPRAELERQVLDRLIMSKLQVARADETGIRIADSEIDQTLGQIAAQNRMDVDQLRQAITRQGMSWEQFRHNVHDESLIQKLRQRVVQSRVQVSDTEIELLLKNGGVQRGQLHLGHIQITLPDGASPEQIAAAQAKAEDVARQIRDGMDFAAAAIRYSDAQNALDGGDLGWRSYDELPPAFAEIAEKLQIGQSAPPVRGPNGFHIIKLIERREATSDLVTEYHARHILVRITEIVSAAQAEKTIRDLRARILAGEDFAKLAKEFSNDTGTANLGGDMGWFVKGAYGSKIAEMLTETKVGEISEPFLSDAGWHILEPLATRTEDKTAEAERDKARQTLGSRKAEEEYGNFLRQIRAEAYIEIRLPGAAGASGSGS